MNSNLISIAEVYHGKGEKPRRKFAEVRGIQLHYLEFRQDRYHVIAPDLRGHGDSDKPQTGCRLRDFTEDIRQLINLNLRRPAYIGHSRDGTSAQSLASDDRGEISRAFLEYPVYWRMPHTFVTQVLTAFYPIPRLGFCF